jgi:iron complex outermembrane receptor protein
MADVETLEIHRRVGPFPRRRRTAQYSFCVITIIWRYDFSWDTGCFTCRQNKNDASPLARTDRAKARPPGRNSEVAHDTYSGRGLPMRRTARIRSLLICGVAAATFTVPAFAQEATAPAATPEQSQTDEIVVTAQFREQNLQDTPLAITAVSGAMLEARSQTSIADVANQAPSVTLKPQGAAYGPALGASIRGVGQYDYNPALEPGVGVYVDDVYYATLTGSIFDLLDLERVEVLRGPQGTLAGKNSIGGAIKLYSRKPEGTNTGYIAAAYGSRNRVDLRGSVDLGIVEGLSVRLAAVGKRQEGYISRIDYGCAFPTSGVTAVLSNTTDCVVAKEGDVNYQAFRGQLRYAPSEDFEINLIADYTIEDRNSAGQVLRNVTYNNAQDINPFATPILYDNRFVCGPYCNYASYISYADNGRPTYTANGRSRFEGYGFSGNIEWRLSDALSLQSITAYREYTANFTNDDDLSPLAHGLSRNDVDFWSFSQEVRLNGALLDDLIEFTVGGFYAKQESLSGSFQDLRYAGLATFQQNDPVRANTKAAFAHLAVHPTEQLTLTAGLRYTDEYKDYTFYRRTPTGGAHPQLGSLDGVTGVYDGAPSDRFDYRLNAQYAVTDDIMVYGQFATGFKGGGISPRPFNVAQVRSFAPETIKSYELGIKTDLFDRLLRLNIATYFSNYKDIQLSLSSCPQFGGPGPCALVTNAGDAEIKGFEVEATLKPSKGFVIDAALSYLDFKYVSINPLAGGPLRPTGPQLDDRPPYVPNWKWSIGAQYEIPLGGSGSLTPRFDAAYQGDLYSNATNRPSNLIEGYVLANARLTYRNAGGDIEISLEGTNLFDKYYILTNFDQTVSAAGGGFNDDQPGRPREWAISLKKKF